MTTAASDELLHRFSSASQSEKLALLKTEPGLLKEASARRLEEVAEWQPDPKIGRALAAYAQLIRLCIQEGVDDVFQQLGVSSGTEQETPSETQKKIETILALQSDPRAANHVIALCDAVLGEVAAKRDEDFIAALKGIRANSLQHLGDSSGNLKYFSQAIDGYDDALETITRTSNPLNWAITTHSRSRALLATGELTGNQNTLLEAITGFEAAIGEIDETKNPSIWASAQQDRALAFENLGHLAADTKFIEKALKCYDEALASWSKIENRLEWATTKQNKGKALVRLGELFGASDLFHQAVGCFDLALKYLDARSSHNQWVVCKQNRAGAFQRTGEILSKQKYIRDAIDEFSKVLSACKKEINPFNWAMVCHNRGTAYESLGRLVGETSILQAAINDYELALEIRTLEVSPAAWSETQQNRAIALQFLGDLTGDPSRILQALRGYENALIVRTQEANPNLWAMTKNNQAIALQSLGVLTNGYTLFGQAVDACDAALTVRTKEASATAWAETQQNRSNALVRLGNRSLDTEELLSAIYGYDAALEVFTRNDHPANWARVQQNRANALQILGTLTDNENALRAALDGYEAAMQARFDQANSWDWSETKINQALAQTQMIDLTGDLSYSDQALSALRSALEVLTMESSPDQCMLAVSSLVRLLVDRGDFDEARSRLDEALEGGLAHLVRVENRAARERAIEQAAGLAELRAWIAIAKDADAGTALTYLERGRAQLLALSLAEDPEKAFAKGLAELGDLLAAIPAEGAAVLPIIGPAGAQVAVVPGGRTSVTPEDFLDLPELTRTRFQGWFFGPEDEPGLGGYLRAYQEGRLAWADPHAEPELARLFPETLSATLAEVWVHLLGPVDARLAELGLAEGAPVAIMPPGLMGLVPLWAAAPEDGAPFGSRWTVSLAPSLTALRAARKRSAGWEEAEAPVRTLAVLDPASEGQRRLPGAALEGGLLAQILGPDQVTALGGDDATAAAMTDAMPGRSHLHLSMHGFFSPNLPDQSALLLAGEDRLTLRALQELEAAEQLRLVVLSACDSGLPGLQRGRIDEFIGLPAGFLQAGAAAVIASHWPVRDDAAFFLMWRFYREYLDETGRERQSPAAALKAASLWLRDVTLGELATLFEPAQDADGPVPFTIDRSKPRQTPEPKADRAPPATALTLEAHLRAAPSPRKPADEAPKGPVDDALYDRIDRVKKDNANVYILHPSGNDPATHKPFNSLTNWAAFSVTGV